MKKINAEKNKIIKKIAKEYFKLKNVSAIVLGGSVARSFSDNYSDIEIYVYYEKKIPSKKEIQIILNKLHAKLTRSKNMHWFHPAWGVHTFFSVNKIDVELGYRNIVEIRKRMKKFLEGMKIESERGVHDCPFGHYESGVASCIKESKILKEKNKSLSKIKRMLKEFPRKLYEKKFNYYFKDAKTIWRKKLLPATRRNDTYHFNAYFSRILRSIVICLFTLNKEYFPGDKWNKEYIKKFKIIPKNYEKNIKLLQNTPDGNFEHKEIKTKLLYGIIKDIKKLYEYEKRRYEKNY